MTFSEVEDIVDGLALLETEDGKLYEYCSAAVDCVKPIKKFCFMNIDNADDELEFTYNDLRKNKMLHVHY